VRTGAQGVADAEIAARPGDVDHSTHFERHGRSRRTVHGGGELMGLRLADLLGGLSIVADLGFGLTPEEAMRTCLLSTALARRMGLGDSDVRDAFYVPLLMHVGCISQSHETAAAFGDELNVARSVSLTNLGHPEDINRTLIPELTRGLPPAARARVIAYTLAYGIEFGRRYDTGACEVARATARRIGLPESTQRALYEVAEMWRGGAAPQGLRGGDIAVAARLARLAGDAVFFGEVGGVERAVAALRERAGTVLDPAIADVFITNATDLLAEAGTEAGDPRDRILEVEPEPFLECGPEEITVVAAAFGDLADLKSPYFHGHATKVARLAVAAGGRAGLASRDVRRLEVAALLHDVGRVGTPNAVWEKEAALTRAEWEQVRMHSYHAERVLATARSLEPMAQIAGMHHERMDGAGYHRGCRGADVSFPSRLLAAADAFVAMSSARAYRPAMVPDDAARELRAAVRDGQFDGDAVAAVLVAAGDAGDRRRSAGNRAADLSPAGLTDREIEVLGLVAQGCSNATIADRLFISRRTAEHHVQHVYTKIGASSRAAAALFAVQHDLLPK
jgi:HD-GYP domain-containing protein (c-di-GMP phosphodiesterase class II)